MLVKFDMKPNQTVIILRVYIQKTKMTVEAVYKKLNESIREIKREDNLII